jgi:septation ring formation regulator EzrA
MTDRIATIELILKECLEAAEMIESSDTVTPEVLIVGEEMVLQGGDLLGMAAQNADLIEEELKNKSVKAVHLPMLRDILLDLQSASGCLAVHIKILRNLMEWTMAEDKSRSVDEGYAVFSEALSEARGIEPPASISELCQTHQSISKNLDSYVQIFTKIKEGKDKGDVEMLEEASSDLTKLESEQLLASIEIFSMKEELEKAQEMLENLKREVSSL